MKIGEGELQEQVYPVQGLTVDVNLFFLINFYLPEKEVSFLQPEICQLKNYLKKSSSNALLRFHL